MIIAAIVVAGLAASACGGADDEGNDARSDAAVVEDRVAPDSAADPVPATRDTGSADDPFTGFQLDADAANTLERRLALLLRNHDDRMAIVYADGGAGEVLLDSVPPGSEIRIDILSRASTIALRSVTPDGELLREAEVSPGPDTVVAVIVGSSPAAR